MTTAQNTGGGYVYRFFKVSNEEQALSRMKQVLEEGTLFATSPKKFNDPFEFKLNISCDAPEDQLRKQFFTDNPTKTASDFETWRHATLRPRGLAHVSSLVREEFLSSHAIACFAREIDSQLMWSHYGPDHLSFCAVFDVEKLRRTDGVQMSGPVRYSDDAPCINYMTISDRELILSAFFTKAKAWQYEQEFRLIFDREGAFKFPPDSLKGIVLVLTSVEKRYLI